MDDVFNFVKIDVLSAPINGFKSVLCQKLIAFAEMLAPKETSVSAERRGVCTFKHKVVGVGDVPLFASGVCAPKHKHNRLISFVQFLDDAVREDFPALSSVASCLSCADCQHCVQKENSLLCPVYEIGVGVGYA